MSVALRLYVSARSPHSARAERVFETLSRRLAVQGGTCDVVDVFLRPELAEEDGILATPTLVRRAPAPARRVVGELGDLAGLVERLDLPAGLLEGSA